MATKKKTSSKPAVAPATAGELSEKESAAKAASEKEAEEKAAEKEAAEKKAAEKEAAEKAAAEAKAKKKAPEFSPELRARLKGIFQDDPEAEAYYSQDGETFLNADQYEARENKKDFTKYIKPE